MLQFRIGVCIEADVNVQCVRVENPLGFLRRALAIPSDSEAVTGPICHVSLGT